MLYYCSEIQSASTLFQTVKQIQTERRDVNIGSVKSP